ncbi:MAG TPA: AraC family transcriptional regulator [Burkholderiales bacterium]|nr:AraC family transcriptional regulator [Burkholderiales bacterium]
MHGRETFALQKVQQAIVFMDRHLSDRLTLPLIAGQLKISPCHFAHEFKRATGVAPHQYLIQRRIERARHLLASSDLPIADIALAVGFANQSHFSALFHRVAGMTPQVYRAARHRPGPQDSDIRTGTPPLG